MTAYQAPLKDIRFLLEEVFEADKLWQSLAGTKDVVDSDTVNAILEEAAKISSTLLAPLNRSGDEEGCLWTDGNVSTPEGFQSAYQTFIEGGWCGLSGNAAYGGMGMPKMLSAQVEEMIQSANIAFGLYPMLTSGACLAIDAHASKALKQQYLPNMYAGVWSGAMDLTEPHSGTDLGLIKTKAEPNDDGSYTITGTKIFITGGEHDLSENIIHLVLAKLPDAPAGSKGISLFIVPKKLVGDDGQVGAPNQVNCGSIEHKMGIKASATCVMNFDGAKGWLVGNENEGLKAMFTMMNYERLAVGIQGLGASELSFQNAVAYARERLQGRASSGVVNPEQTADPIIVHPDVRRMLMTMKANIEAGRAFSTYVAKYLDISKFSDNRTQKQHAAAMVALLTPVAKAYMTDRGLENCVNGQQVFGGHGYIREWGQEQLVRDVRIAQIYEGANGVQALDLMGRKVVANNGELVALFTQEIRHFITENIGNEALKSFIPLLAVTIKYLEQATESVIEAAKTDSDAVGAASFDYLELMGLTAYAYMWALMVKAAAPKVASDVSRYYDSKLKTAHYFYRRMLPRAVSLLENIRSGSKDMMSLEETQFLAN